MELTRTVTVGNIFGSANALSFVFSISNMFSPPSSQPTDTISIASFDSNNKGLDECAASIINLQAQSLTISLTTNNPLIVNQQAALIFTFTLPDTIDQNDLFVITFPANSQLNYQTTVSSDINFDTGSASFDTNSLQLTLPQTNALKLKFKG